MKFRKRLAVFLDGPLAGDFRNIPEPHEQLKIPLPPRITVCDCDPEGEIEIEDAPAEIFIYHRVCIGSKIVIYSKHEDDYEAIKDSIQFMFFTGVNNVDRLIRRCRSPRAFT